MSSFLTTQIALSVCDKFKHSLIEINPMPEGISAQTEGNDLNFL